MKRTVTALIAVGALALSGCSSDANGDKGTGKKAADAEDAVLSAARSYQEAKNRQDWRDACQASSKRLRGGSLGVCVDSAAPSVTPTPEESSPSFTPPSYADGSTPTPKSRPSASGPERADTGPVSASDVVTVPATDEHPAGYGVLVTYSVKWPGKDATNTRIALRLIREGGAWRVDQHEDIQEGDTGHGSPVRTALSGG